MQDTMLDIVNQFGCFGVFFLILIETIFPPIPSEAVLLFGGALTISTTMGVPETILAATAGSLIGAVILYALGRVLQPGRLKALFAGKFGKTLHLKPEYVDRSVAWFSKYQSKAVLICRCVPLVRSLISIPAGFASMNIPKFLLLTTIGSAVWNTFLVLTGAMLGSTWERALPYLKQYTVIVVVAIGVLCILFAVFWIIRKRKKQKADLKHHEEGF